MSRHEHWPERLEIDASAFVAPGATVVGEVRLGARASVWFQSVLRGDTAGIVIGADSNVQDLTTVHTDEGFPAIVGERVTIGHRAIIHGCVIEDDCLIGMGAVILTGARIGRGSLIGASALVKEHQVIPPGSLVLGAPARVIGPVTDAHREAIRLGAEHYVSLGRSYLARGIAAAPPATTWADAHPPVPLRLMDTMEWEQRLDALRAAPRWCAELLETHDLEALRRRPGEGRWCALEVAAHLLDCDREVYLPRVRRVLAETFPVCESIATELWVEERRHREADPARVIAEWRESRAALVRLLEPLAPAQWHRPMLHSTRGPLTLAEMVRYMNDHDLGHRRQMRAALGAFA